MKPIKLKTVKGEDVTLNPAYIVLIASSDTTPNATITMADGTSITVPKDYVEKISFAESDVSKLSDLIPRLITAIERLTVHIPTSIRMHM